MRGQEIDIRSIINSSLEDEPSDDPSSVGFMNQMLEMASTKEARESESAEVIKNYAEEEEAFDLDEGEDVPVDVLTQEVITINVIKDTQGLLSDKVREVMEKYNVVCVPFSIAGILEQVDDLRDYVVYELNGVKYAMYNAARNEVVVSYVKQIKSQLEAGLPYKKVISTVVETEDGTFQSFSLTSVEWMYICNLFRNYNSRMRYKNGELFMMVG
jgi:hypothetical protein